MHHTHPSRRRSAFTLIELLVVISIIALLISILLPALKSARDVARLVKCGTQQKQVSLGLFMYGADYDSWTPDPSVYFTEATSAWAPKYAGSILAGDNWRGYQNKLSQLEYVGNLEGLSGGFYSRVGTHTSVSAFACPDDLNDDTHPFLKRIPLSYYPNLANPAWPNTTGIPGFFNVGSMGMYQYGGNPYSVKSNLDLYAAPSAYFLLLEMNSREVPLFTPDVPRSFLGRSGYSSLPIRNRNNIWNRNFSHGVSNIAFADGHVASLSEKELQFTSDAPDGTAKAENWYLNTGAIKLERHTP